MKKYTRLREKHDLRFIRPKIKKSEGGKNKTTIVIIIMIKINMKVCSGKIEVHSDNSVHSGPFK